MFAGLPHSEELLQNLCQADRWEVRPEGKPKTFLQQGIIPEQAYFAGQLSPLKLSHDDEEPWQVRLESLRFASWTGLPIALWDFEMPRPSTTLSVRAHTHTTLRHWAHHNPFTPTNGLEQMNHSHRQSVPFCEALAPSHFGHFSNDQGGCLLSGQFPHTYSTYGRCGALPFHSSGSHFRPRKEATIWCQ